MMDLRGKSNMGIRKYTWLLLLLIQALCLAPIGKALNNGLALTPPMGWLSWERFRCNTDCTNDPKNCISEDLIKAVADHLARDGYRDAGYEYVIVDDCWLAKEGRDPQGKLRADPERFPSGIRALADYVHERGLKFGIYGDIGTKTCGGYPGMQGHFKEDAQTYADWGVDYLKVDGCYADTQDFQTSYPELGAALNATGRPMVYSCSWPAYLPDPVETGFQVPYDELRQHCNLWRNWIDIQDSWESLRGIVGFWAGAGLRSKGFTAVAGPGSWNDPDMLLAGNQGLSEEQAQLQMGLWAVFAAPLLMSNDLRNISAAARATLLNREVIAINQDPAGRQGMLVACRGNDTAMEAGIWRRELADGSQAVAFVNLGEGPTHLCHSLLHSIWTPPLERVQVRDVFTKKTSTANGGKVCLDVEPTSLRLVRIFADPAVQES